MLSLIFKARLSNEHLSQISMFVNIWIMVFYITAMPPILTTISQLCSILIHLGAISPDALSKRPALLLKLLIFLQLNAFLINDRNTVLVQAPRVTIEQNLHTLPHNLDRLIHLQRLRRLLIRHRLPQNRLSKMSTKPSR